VVNLSGQIAVVHQKNNPMSAAPSVFELDHPIAIPKRSCLFAGLPLIKYLLGYGICKMMDRALIPIQSSINV
jgi:hypothetical protein